MKPRLKTWQEALKSYFLFLKMWSPIPGLLFVLLFFQNCTPVKFTQQLEEILPQTSQSVGGNGGSYDGKLTFVHAVPGFKCELNPAPKAVLRRDSSGWKYTENRVNQCGAIDNQSVNDVQYTEGRAFLVYRGMDFILDTAGADGNPGFAGLFRELSVSATANQNLADINPGDDICASSEGLCSLKAAFDEVNSKPTQRSVILLPAGTFNIKAPLASTSQSFIGIFGAGPSSTIIQSSSTLGVFQSPFNFVASMTIQNLAVQGGQGESAFGATGVQVYASTLVKNVRFESQSSPTSGSPVIYAGVSAADLYVDQTQIINNANAGIGVFGARSVTVVDSNISNNGGWGVNVNNGSWNVQLIRTSVNTNAIGGVRLRKCYSGCGIDNSTISYNGGDGLWIQSTTDLADNIFVRSSTMVANGTTSGYNIHFSAINANPRYILLENSILDMGLTARPNCFYDPTNANMSMMATNSMVSDSTCIVGAGITVASPNLDILRANGGLGLTHRLLSGSPAIDAGSNALCTSPIDQTGQNRIRQSTASAPTCDIGSVETP